MSQDTIQDARCPAEHGFKILLTPSRKVYPKALCTNLDDQLGKDTLELRAYSMYPKSACGCSWLVSTLGAYQPSIKVTRACARRCGQ